MNISKKILKSLMGQWIVSQLYIPIEPKWPELFNQNKGHVGSRYHSLIWTYLIQNLQALDFNECPLQKVFFQIEKVKKMVLDSKAFNVQSFLTLKPSMFKRSSWIWWTMASLIGRHPEQLASNIKYVCNMYLKTIQQQCKIMYIVSHMILCLSSIWCYVPDLQSFKTTYYVQCATNQN